MNSEYAKHEFEVIFFSAEDVMTTSPTPGEDEGEIDVASVDSVVSDI